MKPILKGIDAIKHKLNLRRVQLALEQKRLSAYKTMGAKDAYSDCLIEVNKSKIEILKLENKILKHDNGRHTRKHS